MASTSKTQSAQLSLLGASKGGRARAEVLTREERKNMDEFREKFAQVFKKAPTRLPFDDLWDATT